MFNIKYITVYKALLFVQQREKGASSSCWNPHCVLFSTISTPPEQIWRRDSGGNSERWVSAKRKSCLAQMDVTFLQEETMDFSLHNEFHFTVKRRHYKNNRGAKYTNYNIYKVFTGIPASSKCLIDLWPLAWRLWKMGLIYGRQWLPSMATSHSCLASPPGLVIAEA